MSENDTDQHGTPVATAFLERIVAGRRETVRVTRHDDERLILSVVAGAEFEAYVPGTGPVDPAQMARLFEQRVANYLAAGWTADPWDVPDPLNRPCPF